MMTIYPKVAEINCETGETIVREQTEEEQIAYDLAQQELNDKIAADLASEVAKEAATAKLAALGLTTEDLKALGL
jgi:hypothetical protein